MGLVVGEVDQVDAVLLGVDRLLAGALLAVVNDDLFGNLKDFLKSHLLKKSMALVQLIVQTIKALIKVT